MRMNSFLEAADVKENNTKLKNYVLLMWIYLNIGITLPAIKNPLQWQRVFCERLVISTIQTV